jgi:hypothetical protein
LAATLAQRESFGDHQAAAIATSTQSQLVTPRNCDGQKHGVFE